jgi:hypothetical protein
MRSGLTHLRYDHERRPTLIEVKCPKCHGRARATEPCYAEGDVIVGEGSCPHWEKPEWSIACLACTFRSSGQSYFEIGELFYRTVTRGVEMWAWNREHLHMVYDLLSDRPVDNHRYAWFATYAHRDWLKGSRRKALAKAAEKLLLG